MIGFVAPAALTGLVLALGPLLIHLLQRRQARRVVVPTVRFVPPVSHSSLRLRAPDDVVLLLLRTAAIVAAVVALAGPVVLTEARTAAWNERIVRAVVVDTSASAAAAQDEGVLLRVQEGVSASRRFASDRLGEALKRAGHWLESAPPGRREVVIVSDFQAGSLNPADLTALPEGAGLRFERTGIPRPAALEPGLEYYNGLPHRRHVALDGWATGLALSRGVETGAALRIEGVSAEQAQRLERVVRDAGVSASRADATVIVRFGALEDQKGMRAEGPAAAALLRLLATGNTEATGNTGNTEKGEAAANAWSVQGGRVAFSARAEGDTLLVTTTVDPDSFEAAQLVHAAVASWRDPEAYAEAEVQTIGDETLKGWSRDAAPADRGVWRQVGSTDARWFWGLALLCLGAEWILRRRTRAVRESHARAA